MRTRSVFVMLVMLAVIVAGAGAWRFAAARTSGWSAEERRQLQALSIDQLPALAPDPSNRHADDPRAAALGHRLFFDTRLSANGKVACATCHVATEQFQDGIALASGVGTAARRTMPIMATAHSPWQFWDGRDDSQWSQALGPLESAVEHGGTRLGHVRVVARHYGDEYEAVFGGLPDLRGLPAEAGPVADAALATAWAGIPDVRQDDINRAFANIGKAIAAYERLVSFGPSRFDRYVAALASGRDVPENAALNADEVAGARLFVGKGRCVTCHNGPLLTDNHFHNTGVPAVADLPTDEGRWAGARRVLDNPFNCLGRYSDAAPEACEELRFIAADDSSMIRAYKTPSLRNVAERAPYMHAGQLRTLEDVVAHYVRAPRAPAGTSELPPLKMSAREQAQLVAFLRTLSGPVTAPEGMLEAPRE